MRELALPTAPFATAIASFTVGFVKLPNHGGIEDAVCAGSGTLARIGDAHGVITAAHVLEHLPNSGQVGIVEFVAETVHYRKRVIEMADAKKITIGGEACAPHGPDLGFLRLPQESIGWFNGINSFYNLKKHRSDAIEKPPAPNHMHAVIGLIGERTKHLPAERPGEGRKGFEAVFSDGSIASTDRRSEFDTVEFTPRRYADTDLPNSFEGTSGGALWRVFLRSIRIGQRLWQAACGVFRFISPTDQTMGRERSPVTRSAASTAR